MTRDPLPEGELRAVASGFGLDRFLRGGRTDREDLRGYFRLIDRLYESYRPIPLSDEQNDYVVRQSLAAALRWNKRFRDYVLKQEGSSELMRNEVWKAIYEAGAGVLLLTYWEECEGGRWPL